jgi:hypothetical protein
VNADADAERLRLARRAVIDPGYFTENEVGDDVAPRISEMLSAIREGKWDPFHTHPTQESCVEGCPMHGRDPGAAWAAAGALAAAYREQEAARRHYGVRLDRARHVLALARGDEYLDDEPEGAEQ